METESCDFCEATKGDCETIVVGGDGAICNNCIRKCYEIITNSTVESNEEKKTSEEKITPRMIKEHLDQHVIGHDDIKETISVAVYNHYKRINNKSDIELDKSNILLIGPTGTGKTLLAKSIARLLNVPLAIADATSITEAGYAGDDVESILHRLLVEAGGDVALAERGIIFVDEIDKKRTLRSLSGVKDVSGAGVQQALLKMIEGGDVAVPPSGSKRAPGGAPVTMNTDNILFIFGGAFVGLEETMKSQTNIGFARDNNKPEDTKLTAEHLVQYGLIPELLGRIPIRIQMKELTETELVRILTEPKNSICSQYEELFRIDDIGLEFDEDALTEIASIAIKDKTGARGLKTIIEKVLQDTQFILPELKQSDTVAIRVHREAISENEQPIMILKEREVESQHSSE